jgi:hypothetical protein
MAETNAKMLSDLLPQLTDLLALPRDIDLPALYSVECHRVDLDPGWTIRGHLFQDGDDRVWANLSAWAYNAVGQIELGEEYGSEADRVRKASVTVVVGDISVEIWAAVSAAFIPPNTCCIESYRLADACAGCQIESKTSSGDDPLAEIQAAFPHLSRHDAETRLRRAVEANGEV